MILPNNWSRIKIKFNIDVNIKISAVNRIFKVVVFSFSKMSVVITYLLIHLILLLLLFRNNYICYTILLLSMHLFHRNPNILNYSCRTSCTFCPCFLSILLIYSSNLCPSFCLFIPYICHCLVASFLLRNRKVTLWKLTHLGFCPFSFCIQKMHIFQPHPEFSI